MIKTALLLNVMLLFLLVQVSCTRSASESSGNAGELADAKLRQEVSQYGITWTFDKPAKTGQFITGDWWVVGPVKIVNITPAPGPTKPEVLNLKENKWGDTSIKNDTTMRNGSMVVLEVGTEQGYDSRSNSYNNESSVILPIIFEPSRSIISSISNKKLPVDHFAKEIMWPSEKKSEVVLKTAAVLTSLDKVPPKDAFRPPYAGTEKPIFQAKDINWNKLPRLEPTGEVPSWQQFERYFQRPWIDHLMSWEQQQLVPNENGPNYGREHARVVSLASVMLLLDVPKEKKEKLTIGMVQRGIDLYGLAMVGGYWNEGGGHSSGRKWPILFASLMLDNPTLTELPDTAFFQEDTQTYYGKGWFGQTALYWMIQHHGQRDRYEEKHPSQWEKWDKTTESYRICCNARAWIGTALAARYMNAIKLWGHDAYFDYVDRWMGEDDPYKEARGDYPRPSSEGSTFDPFVTEMWRAHRDNAPKQEMAGNPKMWVWQGKKGVWVDNPKPEFESSSSL